MKKAAITSLICGASLDAEDSEKVDKFSAKNDSPRVVD